MSAGIINKIYETISSITGTFHTILKYFYPCNADVVLKVVHDVVLKVAHVCTSVVHRQLFPSVVFMYYSGTICNIALSCSK